MSVSLGGVVKQPPKEIKKDQWAGASAYDPYLNRVFSLEFEKVTVERAGTLPIATVQIYLDDTCNFYEGIGNTRFLRFENDKHSDDLGNMHISNVKWLMMGAVMKNDPSLSFKMPDVAKVVVTGDVNGKHGILGGSVMPLNDLLNGLNGKDSKYEVPIYNSFAKGLESLVTVVFHGSKSKPVPKTLPPNLFKPSALPTKEQSYVINELLGPVIDEFFVDRIDQGIYALPRNAPSNFCSLERDSKTKLLHVEPCKSLFRTGKTSNARINHQQYPHLVSSIPGWNNELEQDGITNKRILLHSFHLASTVFQGYGWNSRTLFEKVANEEFDDELLSFLTLIASGLDTFPATQEYVSDYWLFPDKDRVKGEWKVIGGEDWQVANAMMASWDPSCKWSPSGRDDCESKAHHIMAKILLWILAAGGKGSKILRESKLGLQSVLDYICKHVYGIQGKSSNMNIPEEVRNSILKFAKWALERPISENPEEDTMLAMVLVAAMLASDDFKAYVVLGGAFSPSKTEDETLKHECGHAYGLVVFCGKSNIVEGTAPVLNRGHSTDAETCKSVMMFEKGVATVLETAWLKDNSQASKDKGAKPEFRALMVTSTTEHTGTFYGNAYVVSKCQTFVDATQPDTVHGSMLFTKEDDGKLRFGIEPENPIGGKVVFADMVGHLVDKSISQKSTFKSMINQQTQLGADMDKCRTISSDKPFTDSINASVNSIRELSGQRISPKDWDVWIDRMYGKKLSPLKRPPATPKKWRQHLFNQPGRVMRVVVTFQDAKSASEVRAPFVLTPFFPPETHTHIHRAK